MVRQSTRRNPTVTLLVAALAVVLTPLIIGTTQSLHSSDTSENHTMTIGFIGDSITVGYEGTRNAVQNELSDLGQAYSGVNRGVGGSKTSDWLPGGKNFDDAVVVFQSQNVHTVSLMLGTNDMNDPETAQDFFSNMQQIATGLLDRGIDRIIVNYPPYIVSGNNAKMMEFRTQLDKLTATNTHIIRGDTKSYAYFEHHLNELVDGIHPNDVGYHSLGVLWANAFKDSSLSRI